MTPLECRAARQKVKYRIRERLEHKGASMTAVAEHLNVNIELVRQTICGNRNNRRVLLALRDEFGVPARLLFIPETRKPRKEAA